MRRVDDMKIQSLSVEKLWNKFTFSIDFNEKVTILIGKNGSGKSTILNLLDKSLSNNKKDNKYKFKKVSIDFDKARKTTIEQRKIDISKEISELEEVTEETLKTLLERVEKDIIQRMEEKDNKKIIALNKDETSDKEKLPPKINYLFLSTFDMEMKNKELLQKHYNNSEIKTELDILLNELITKFKLYQLSLKEKVEKVQESFDIHLEDYVANDTLKEELLEKNQKISDIYRNRDMFKNKLNTFFSDTGKSIKLDENNSIIFKIKEEETLSPYQLSSGEKQILIILLNIMLLENKPTIILMDEPEISLHVEWQSIFIQTLLDINPNLQLIITTHSPAIVSKGYRNNMIKLENFKIKS